MIEGRNSGVHKRQFEICTSECDPFGQILQCFSADCICPILNSTDPSLLTTCTNCLESNNSTLGGNMTLLAKVCTKCENPCMGVIDQAFQSSTTCLDFYCTCQLFDALSSTDITTCASCIHKIDSGDAITLVKLAQQCGIISASAASSLIASISNMCSQLEVDLFGKVFWISVIIGVLGSRFLVG